MRASHHCNVISGSCRKYRLALSCAVCTTAEERPPLGDQAAGEVLAWYSTSREPETGSKWNDLSRVGLAVIRFRSVVRGGRSGYIGKGIED